MSEKIETIITNNNIELELRKDYDFYLGGQIASFVQELNTIFNSTVTPNNKKLYNEIYLMLQREPVAAQALNYKCVRTLKLLGRYKHSNRIIDNFVNKELDNLKYGFKETIFRGLQYLYAFGFVLIEPAFFNYKLVNLRVLNPMNIRRILGSYGKPTWVVYDNGRGRIVSIPFDKLIHLTNSNISSLGDDVLLGRGDGNLALNYYKLKKGILTQLAIATKNNAQGLIHVKSPNNARIQLLDSDGQPMRNPSNPSEFVELSKPAYLDRKMKDISSKEYVITDSDVDINLINLKTDVNFWQYVLQYVDVAIQRCFSIPIGIFDTGGVNTGLSANFGASLDATIEYIIHNLSNHLIRKVIKPMLFFNFTTEEIQNDFGKFVFVEDKTITEKTTILNLLSTLMVSNILDKYDPKIVAYINDELGLSSLTEGQILEILKNKDKELFKSEQQDIVEHAQVELTAYQLQVQKAQLELELMQIEMQKQALQMQMLMQQQGIGSEEQSNPTSFSDEDMVQ